MLAALERKLLAGSVVGRGMQICRIFAQYTYYTTALQIVSIKTVCQFEGLQ
jgi:hypothetical protein